MFVTGTTKRIKHARGGGGCMLPFCQVLILQSPIRRCHHHTGLTDCSGEPVSAANQTLYGWRTWRQAELVVLWEMCQKTWRYSFKPNEGFSTRTWQNNNRATDVYFVFCFIYKVAQSDLHNNYCIAMHIKCITIIIYLHNYMPFERHTPDRSIYSVHLLISYVINV